MLTIITNNPYKWHIFYLFIQSLIFIPILLFVWYINKDHAQTQYIAGSMILFFGIAFVLVTAQGERKR